MVCTITYGDDNKHLELRQKLVSCAVLHFITASRLSHHQDVVNVHLTTAAATATSSSLVNQTQLQRTIRSR